MYKHKKITSILLAIIMVLSALPFTAITSFAETTYTSGYYTYTVSNGEATITKCDTSISGDITIPSTLGGYPVTSIGSSAFGYCKSLENITIPDSVTSISNAAFGYCTSLTSITIPNGVTIIGDWAFQNCTSLTNITIPDSVTSIGVFVFERCTSLTNINVDSKNQYYSNENGILFNKDKTTLIKYPEGKTDKSYTVQNSVTSIGDRAFYNCTSLTSITIPNSVTSIGYSAFCGCTSLESITIPDSVTNIGWEAFNGCTSLESISIPNSVTSIGEEAFYHCASLTSITIPNSVTSIGYSAFCGCTSLESITIPDSVTNIGWEAFNGCTSLESISIPNSVTNIGNYAFYNCTSLTSITIPNSVTSIGNYAFAICKSLTTVYFCGTEDEWNNISIGSSNESLTNATRVYHKYAATAGTKTGYTDYVCSECGDSYQTPNSYNVTFNANGGSCSTDNKNVTFDSAYGTLPTPTKTGYTFTGWYTSSVGGSQVTSSTTVSTASNHTLYAHWSPNSYNLTLNANGGSCSTSSNL